jgi:hypothetical protein
MGFVSFMSSTLGRVLRIVVGLGLIGWGLYLVLLASSTAIGIILAVVGLLPFAAGLFDVCVFAPLFGAPMNGVRVRASAK